MILVNRGLDVLLINTSMNFVNFHRVADVNKPDRYEKSGYIVTQYTIMSTYIYSQCWFVH